MRSAVAAWTGTLVIMLAALLTPNSAEADGGSCFRPRPSPTCKRFWVTELSLGYMPHGEGRLWSESELGLMYNMKDRDAAGLTSYIAFDSQSTDLRRGVMVRYGRWVRSDLSMNISGGVLLAGGAYDESHPGWAGHVDVDYKDMVAPYLGIVATQRGDRHASVAYHAGLRFGSYIGAGTTVAAAALIALALIGRELGN